MSMDDANLINASCVVRPASFEQAAQNAIRDTRGAKTEQLAKDFESVLLSKLVDEMKETIGQGFEEEDVAAGQVKGLFWLYLSRDLADKGGLGLWKDLSRLFTDIQKPGTMTQTMNEGI